MILHRHALRLLLGRTCGICALSLALASSALAQKAKSPTEPAGNLIVGTVAAERGTVAAIPIYYEPGKNGAIGRLDIELDFVSNSVKFARIEKGVASEGQTFEAKADAKEQPPDDKNIKHTRLNLSFALPEGATNKSLPSGLLAFLNFDVPPEAKPFSIALNPITVAAQDAAKKPAQVVAEAGKIIVSVPDEPLAGCFFFTH